MNEFDVLARMGADVPPLADAARAHTRAQILTRAHHDRAHVPTDVKTPPATILRPRRRRRLAFGLGLATIAAAAAAVAVGLPFVGGTPAAYAVEKHPDGTVDVQIREFLQPKKLQATLRKAGVPAVVDYVPMGQTCQQPRGHSVTDGEPVRAMPSPADQGLAFRVFPDQLKPGQTLVLEASFAKSAPEKAEVVRLGVIRGPVTECAPVSTSRPAPIVDGPHGQVPPPKGSASDPATPRAGHGTPSNR